MFEKYGDYELVDLLYDDLYDWLDFMWTSRREPPLNLICLGSECVAPFYAENYYLVYSYSL